MSTKICKAPEALMKQEYSEKTDVWSFGITVIEIFTREIPYPNKTISEIISAISKQQLPIEWNEEEWSSETIPHRKMFCI